MPPTISIITCTRNPRPAALSRVLTAIASLRTPAGHDREYLITDSASDPALSSRPELTGFLGAHRWARIVRLDEAGLSTARRAALRESSGALLVWFDDDNVPAPDYLEHVASVAAVHPDVTVWGAGTIDVEFVDPVPAWVDREMRPLFQQRSHGRDEFGGATTWAPFFPVGSGMVTRRAAMERWAEATVAGRYSLTGRRGGALSSGDDAQIIFAAIAAGESVGVVAAQRLTHLIPAERCTMSYLARLEFVLSASLRVARAECFPSDPGPRMLEGLGPLRAVRAALSAWRRDGARASRLETARRLGALSGSLQTMSRPEPWWLRAAITALALR